MILNHVKVLGLHLGLAFLFAIVSIATMDYSGAWGIITALSFLSYIILGYFFLQQQETVGHDFLSVAGLAAIGLLFYMIDSATESPGTFVFRFNGLLTELYTLSFTALIEQLHIDWDRKKEPFTLFVLLPTLLFWSGLGIKRYVNFYRKITS